MPLNRGGGPTTTATALPARSTFHNLAVTHLATILTFAAQVPYTAVVSRVLSPADFGLVALATVMLRFASYFAGSGVVTALIQRPVLLVKDLRAAFTISVATSTVFCVLIVIVAPQLADVFGNAAVTPVARAMSLTLVIGAVGNSGLAMLRREGRFRALAGIDLGSYALAYPVVGIAMAVAGFGVWSLVAAALIQSTVASLAAILLARPPLRPTKSTAHLWPLARFSGGVSAIGFVEFFSANTDTLAVARYSGTTALGHYSRASLLLGLPLYYFTNNTLKVVFPRLSKEQHSPTALGEIYGRIMVILVSIFVPLCVLMFFISAPLVNLLLGPGWGLAASLVPLVSLAMVLDLTSHMPGAVYEAMGRLRLRLGVQLLHLISIVILVSIVVSKGGSVRLLAYAWIMGQLIRHGAFLATMPKVLGMSIRQLARPYLEGVALGAAMLVGAASGSQLGDSGFFGELFLPCSLGAVATILAVRLVPNLNFRQELLKLPFGERLVPILVGNH